MNPADVAHAKKSNQSSLRVSLVLAEPGLVALHAVSADPSPPARFVGEGK